MRPFRLADAAAVEPWLDAPGLSLPPGALRTDWAARMIADAHILARVAVRRGQIVAFARLDCGPDRVAEVTLCVAPEYRRQGLGRAVLEAVVQEARQRGLRRLQAMVEPRSQESLQFFSACGFEEDGVLGGRWRLSRIVHTGDSQLPLEIDL